MLRPSSRTFIQPYVRGVAGVALALRGTVRTVATIGTFGDTAVTIYPQTRQTSVAPDRLAHGRDRDLVVARLPVPRRTALHRAASAGGDRTLDLSGRAPADGLGLADAPLDSRRLRHRAREATRPTVLSSGCPPFASSVDDAIAAILAEVAPSPSVPVPLAEALGGVLAEDVVAPFALPQWTNAAMDGYAVHGDDVRGASREPLHHAAGRRAHRGGRHRAAAARPGEAMRIFTGGPVPEGADTVIRQEDSDRGAEVVRIHGDRDPVGMCAMPAATSRQAVVVLPRGHDIGPGEISLLAALAITTPPVHRRPVVAIISSGDELASLDDPTPIRAGSRLADSNTPTLAALTHLAGRRAAARSVRSPTTPMHSSPPSATRRAPNCSSPSAVSPSAITTTCPRCCERSARGSSFDGYCCDRVGRPRRRGWPTDGSGSPSPATRSRRW